MQTDHREILKHLSPKRILWPVLIGVIVAAWLFLKEFDIRSFDAISWTMNSSLWLALAIASVALRDFAYMVRIKILTDQQINWYRSFIVIMLWEFSSALAPGMLGGGFLFAIFILNKEGVNMGKSITAIMNSSFLDGIFLVVMAPFVYWIAGKDALFSGIHLNTGFGSSIFYTFWTVYFLILAYKLFIAYALFVNPQLVRRGIVGLFSVKFLRRWKKNARETGDQLVIASNGLREKDWNYWWTSMAATFVSWTARYSIVNCIIHAFHGDAPINDFVIYGKQVVMGIILLLSPTPGGSGLAEFIFNDFLGVFIAKGLAPTLGLLWRTLSYYPYLFIGAIILPKWIRGHIKIDKLKL